MTAFTSFSPWIKPVFTLWLHDDKHEKGWWFKTKQGLSPRRSKNLMRTRRLTVSRQHDHTHSVSLHDVTPEAYRQLTQTWWLQRSKYRGWYTETTHSKIFSRSTDPEDKIQVFVQDIMMSHWSGPLCFWNHFLWSSQIFARIFLPDQAIDSRVLTKIMGSQWLWFSFSAHKNLISLTLGPTDMCAKFKAILSRCFWNMEFTREGRVDRRTTWNILPLVTGAEA